MNQEELKTWKLLQQVACVHAIESGLHGEFNAEDTLLLSQVVVKYPIPAIMEALTRTDEFDDSLNGLEDHLKYLAAKGQIPKLIDLVEQP